MATPPPQHGAGPYPPYTAQQGAPYAVPQQPPAPYGPYQGAPGPYPAPTGYGCRLCGAQPAAAATVRGHQGLIVLMRFLSLQGPFCRDCGLATYRRMSGDTLWQGWWGPLSFFITPVTLLVNLGPRASFRRLAPPTGGFRPAMDPGKPLWRRPAALLFLVPVALFLLAVPTLILIGLAAGDDKPVTLRTGQCVRNEGDWNDQKLLVTDCGSPNAEYRVHSYPCDEGFIADLKYSADGSHHSCLTPLR
ncbi:hypothetical protein AB0B01_20650 [Streptomyces sp. NPDC044571]|uniref:LppU/SCO3897 family protein n=1 Tax=Streptomyces sp. NPDC044571 TaxID=3155371 RepID=UPI0033E62ECA